MGHGLSPPRDRGAPRSLSPIIGGAAAAMRTDGSSSVGGALGNNNSQFPGSNGTSPREGTNTMAGNGANCNGSGVVGGGGVGRTPRGEAFPPLPLGQGLCSSSPPPGGARERRSEATGAGEGRGRVERRMSRRRRGGSVDGWISTRRSTGTIQAILRTDLV